MRGFVLAAMAVVLSLGSLSFAQTEDTRHSIVRDVASQLSDGDAPFTLTVTLIANADQGDQLEAALTEHVAASRMETGNMAFVVSRDAMDRDRLVLFEQWASIDAFDAHFNTAHMQANLPRIGALTESIDLQVTPAAAEGAADEAVLRFYLDLWIEYWSPGAEAWVAEPLRALYSEGPVRVFDGGRSGVAELRSFDECARAWSPMMASMRGWRVGLVEPAEIRVSGDMAMATFVFEGGEDTSLDDPVRIRQYGTLVWARVDGVWRIVHEHLTADGA